MDRITRLNNVCCLVGFLDTEVSSGQVLVPSSFGRHVKSRVSRSGALSAKPMFDPRAATACFAEPDERRTVIVSLGREDRSDRLLLVYQG
jgi:hypothetical protein